MRDGCRTRRSPVGDTHGAGVGECTVESNILIIVVCDALGRFKVKCVEYVEVSFRKAARYMCDYRPTK